MRRGVVKWFDSTKRYGFIAPDDGSADVFVHTSSLERGISSLVQGDVVVFECCKHNGRPCAGNVIVLNDESASSAYNFVSICIEQGASTVKRTRSEPHDGKSRSDQVRQNIVQMQRWFIDISRQLNQLRPLIFERKGAVFKRHLYAVDELLEHHLLRKVSATFGVIEDNIKSWQHFGLVDATLRAVYENEKRRILDHINDITREIHTRKPTFWEIIRGFLGTIAAKLMRRLPASSLKRIEQTVVLGKSI